MNKVLLIGRLGSDPETRWTASGAQVVTMRIATTESYTDHTGNKVEQTEWHRVVTFQKTAEQCARYLTKGRLVYVEGKVQTRQWQDQQGQERTITEIRAEVVRFLDSAGGRQNLFPEEKGDSSPSENRCFSDGSLDVLASSMDDIPF
jgi:single-strand DNA-binding protein